MLTRLYYGSIGLKIGNAQQCLVEVSNVTFQRNLVEDTRGYMKQSIYCLMLTRLCYGSICLKVELARQLSVEIPGSEFQQILYQSSRDTRKFPFIFFSKLRFIMNQYGCKAESSNNTWWKTPITDLNKICETVYGVSGKAHLGLM
jgi:hypothetical protein